MDCFLWTITNNYSIDYCIQKINQRFFFDTRVKHFKKIADLASLSYHHCQECVGACECDRVNNKNGTYSIFVGVSLTTNICSWILNPIKICLHKMSRQIKIFIKILLQK